MYSDYNIISDNLGKVIKNYLTGNIKPIKQDKINATWVPKRNISDCKINFSNNTMQLLAFFRALVSPYPLPYLEVKGRVLQITDFKIIHKPYHAVNGCVVNIDDEGAWIKYAEGLLLIKKMKEDNKEIEPKDHFKIGMRIHQN